MITEQEFLALLYQPESETLDFKATAYDLSEEGDKTDLVKDVMCMANTPRDQTSFIILGVKKHPNGTYDLLGLDKYPDDANLQSQFADRVYPIPEFTYGVLAYQGEYFGIIAIPPRRIGPCVPSKDFGNKLRQRQVYLRRGSKNDIATPEDLHCIVLWIRGNDLQHVTGDSGTPAWERFLSAVHAFDRSRRYVLLASPFENDSIESLSIVGQMPWTAVFDFDPESETTGLLKAAKLSLESHRSLYLVVAEDRPNINPERATCWFFARGLTGRKGTIETGAWKIWVSKYGVELNEQFKRLAAMASPAPVTCIALWYDTRLVRHLQSSLGAALGAFGDSVEFVVVTEHPADLQSVAADLDATLVDIPLHQLCSGLQTVLSKPPFPDGDRYALPSSSGAPYVLDTHVQHRLEEEIEIVHLNVGLTPPPERNIGRDFLRGAQIAWYELGLHYDVDRDKTERLRLQLEDELERKRTVRVNLYHAPGAGGTTVAHRLLWDFHRRYPCAILLRCIPPETADRLFQLSSLTGKAVLLLIDGAQIAERQVDELYDHLRSRQVPVVILQTLRRFKSQDERQRAFYLPAGLSMAEAQRFLEQFSREEPKRRSELEALLKSEDPRARTAFYFGLQTFGKDFLGIDPYVSARIVGLTPIQEKLVGFLALAHRYAQRPIPAQAFAELMGIPRNRTVGLPDSLPEGTFDLLVEVDKGVWRTAHDLLAQAILEQLLWPSGPDRRLWKQNLSTWATDFARFCRGSSPVPSEEMLEVARRTFIYRDNVDLLGTERSASNAFAQLIEDIKSREGQLETLRTLAQLYPEEAHFWAHLGRFYAIEMHDYEQALECNDRAVSRQENDHVLHHMRGMTLRYQIKELIARKAALSDITKIVKPTSSSFEEARRLEPDDEHGFISEVQMLESVLDYAGRQHKGGILEYLSLPSTDPFLRECLERAEDLLEQVRRNREGEGASPYEEDCRGKLDALYGHHGQALQTWGNLLDRWDVYKPPIRRQIVWTYLARRDRSWDALTSNEVARIVDLLETNLREEPNDDKNLRLWVQAVRRAAYPPSIESVIERVGYWKVNAGTLDATYYLYVFYALLALEGSALAREEAKRYIDECRQMAGFRRNRTKSLEWLGTGSAINRLVHHSELGNWLTGKERDFWEKTAPLARIRGRISMSNVPQAGQIEVEGGLSAFYVPARGGGTGRDRLNRLVDFYLGFSYDGLRAWEVRDVE